MKTTPSPAVEWPPGGAGSSSRSASQGKASTDFGALLDTHQARTAVAEGPHREAKAARDSAPAAERADRAGAPAHAEVADAAARGPQDDGAAGPEPEAKPPVDGAVEAEVVVESLVDLSPTVIAEAPAAGQRTNVAPSPAKLADPKAPGAPAPAQPGQPAREPATAAPIAPVAAPSPAKPVLPETAAAQAQQAQAQPQPVQKPQGTVPQAQDPVAGDAAQAAKQKAAEPTAKRAAAQAAAASERSGPARTAPNQDVDRPAAADQRQPVLPQPAQSRPAVAGGRAGDQQAVQPNVSSQQTSVPVAAAPGPQVTVARAEAPVRGVHLSQAADAVENIIRLGAQRGVTHARLSLRPAELGGVEIHLQQTAAGLTASIVADGKEAAQVLQQAGQELRRQLEAQGIQLQTLDISHSGEERPDARSAQAQTGDGERSSQPGDTSSTATDGGELTPSEEIGATSTLELPDGVLVDVLA